MNAISSSINKGSVKVAPKATASRRPRPIQQDFLLKPTPLSVHEDSTGQNERGPDSENAHTEGTSSKTKSLSTRSIPVVGSSSSPRVTHAQLQPQTNTSERYKKSLNVNTKIRGKSVTDAGPNDAILVNAENLATQIHSTVDRSADKTSQSLTSNNHDLEARLPNGTQLYDSDLLRMSIQPDTVAGLMTTSKAHDTDDDSHFQLPNSVDGHGNDAQPGIESTQPRPTKRSRRGCSSRNRHRREPTPEAAEFQVIDATDLRMLDLCKDLRRGKKSVKFQQFKRLAAEKKQRRSEQRSISSMNDAADLRAPVDSAGVESSSTTVQATVRQKLESEVDSRLEEEDEDESDDHDDPEETETDFAPGVTTGAPQVRIVNGKIVLDVGSLQVDRSARDSNGSGAIEYVEEDPLEKVVNSHSYSKHKATPRWDSLSTELFYTGLSQWGTDFDMISRMFPMRTRKQIKNKFTAEERKNPTLVTRALLRKSPVDMQEYSRISEIHFRSISELELDLAELKAKFVTEREEALQEAQERKMEALDGMTNHTVLQDTKKKTRRRAADSSIEVVGNIEEVEAEEREAQARAAMSSDDADED